MRWTPGIKHGYRDQNYFPNCILLIRIFLSTVTGKKLKVYQEQNIPKSSGLLSAGGLCIWRLTEASLYLGPQGRRKNS